MLTEIAITDFRGFTELKLAGLGRVNLIVGKNNTGKTSLLEAISILANPTMLRPLPGLFRANPGNVETRFYRWLVRDGAANADSRLRGALADGRTSDVVLRDAKGAARSAPTGMVGIWAPKRCLVAYSPAKRPELRVHAVSVQHRAPDSMTQSFAQVVRSPSAERQMESLLQAVDPRVRTVRLDLEPGNQPLIAVDVGLSERIPLSQAGQGMYRLVAIFVELLGARPAVTFLDEVENGIHHSVLEQVWTGLAEVAERLSIQLFVTTHSYECIEAAHAAFSKRPNYDLRVIQLFRTRPGVEGRVLDRDLISTALEGGIDLR